MGIENTEMIFRTCGVMILYKTREQDRRELKVTATGEEKTEVKEVKGFARC